MTDFSADGKVVLVTGAARGIGFETARQMHERGASVAVLDLSAEEAEQAARRIGERAIGLACDVTDRGAMEAAVAIVVRRLGGLDIAVANAGTAQSGFSTVRAISDAEWERVVEVDLFGVWRTVRAALPAVVARRGQIVIVSSVSAFNNGFGNSPYAVAKAGVEQLGRALRIELAPHGAGVTVAYFGWTDTKMVRDHMSHEDASRVSELSPRWRRKKITPDVAAAGLVAGIEKRTPRVFVPGWWRYSSAMRGLLAPFLDSRKVKDPKTLAVIRDLDAKALGDEVPSPVRN
jgi:NAD(P)-dependent dehydrogenase (short-subunit alcohol dehydrogenase family)